MKKLRLFDSLKFVVAAIVCTFISNVAHADTSINSVIAYGKTEQSATPTPTNPVPIMTNNGELKVSPNLFDALKAQLADISTVTGGPQATTRRILSDFIPIKPNTKYTASGTFNIDGNNSVVNRLIYAYYDANKGYIENSRTATTTGTTTITTTNNASYKYIRIVYFAATGTNASIANSRLRFEEGSTATTGVYVDGLTETIRDSAGHTATAQMLLGIDDTYRDEQNINTGAITRKVGVKVLNGTENWTEKDQYNRVSIQITDMLNPTSPRVLPAFCNYFENLHNSEPISTVTAGQFYLASPQRVYFHINQSTTTNEFKAHLADQYNTGTPVIVVYPLATETTESVATQSLTTAPVRQTAGSILGMPIEVVLGDGTREWVSEMITIATTKYNEEQFEPVQNELSNAMNVVDDVVTRTMSQAQAIDTIATTKQTRPDEGCPAKYCLLVEDEDGTPHWYPIAGANGVAHALPAGYTELQYIESTGTQYIDTGIYANNTIEVETKFKLPAKDSQTRILFCGRDGIQNAAIDLRRYYDTVGGRVVISASFGATAIQVSSNDTDAHTYSIHSNEWKLDNMSIGSLPTAAFRSDYTIWLFACNQPSPQFRYATIIYHMKIWDDNSLVRDFIPAKNSDNVVGMYDMVSGTFFTNQGTGDFIAGPEM